MKTSPVSNQEIYVSARHVLIFALVSLSYALILSSCTRRDFSQTSESPQSVSTKESWGVQILLSQGSTDVDGSLPRLNIFSDHVQWVGEGDSLIQHLNGVNRKVEIEIFDSTGVVSAFLKADQVSYHESEEYFTAEGGVKIKTRDDRTLMTEWIEWWERDQLLQTDSFVTIRTPEEVLSGKGLEATEDLSSYQIGKFQAKITSDQ